MRFLPFEREYVLEFTPCDRCAGSGRWGIGLRQCHNCRGLGRRVTKEGRELFYDICELLGKPVVTFESRIQPKHLDRIFGGQLRVGMRVARVGPKPGTPLHEIVQVVPAANDSARVVFADGSVIAAGALDTFDRELTESEIARVGQLMAARRGQGAVHRAEVSSAAPRSA